ncbi:MAG TPA: DUF1592 domain-containing protein [Vicinamibacterales bacterium]|nr:DUF1592 domain-containing protein [Vicinamibacterales bacterium]
MRRFARSNRGGLMGQGRSLALGVALALSTLTVGALAATGGQATRAGGAAVTRARPSRPAPAVQPVAAHKAVTTDRAQAAKERALVDQYCVPCHNDRARTDNLTLQNLDMTTAGDHPEIWERVVRKLRAGAMPPPGMNRPPSADYDALRDWLENEIDRRAAGRVNPGTVVMHRLNRTEYANVIRDLLGLEIDSSGMLPPDDSARGFDNQAGSLTISPTLLEAYTTAATRIARMAVGYWKTPTEATYLPANDASQNEHIDGLPLGTRGGLVVRHTFPADGEYKFSIQNFGIGSFVPGEELEIVIDGVRARLFPYEGMGVNAGMTAERDGTLEATIPVKAGSRLVGATFVKTNYRPSLDMIEQYARKSLENNKIPQIEYYPAIGFLKIQGPFSPERPTDSRSLQTIVTCHPASAAQEEPCARTILSRLARRAYRRPVTDADVAPMMQFYREGRRTGTFDDGVELGLRRLLVSPEFLVRAEREPDGVPAGQPYRITDLELASRLSFFLWSSIPDETLIDLASRHTLHEPAVLRQQVARMLKDPRADALVTSFGEQFLALRNLATTSPDGVFYPNWDNELRQAYKRETELFFKSIVTEDRNILDLLTADYTFVNERLAKQYGIPNVYGSQFRRVTLGPEFDARRGLLGKGAFLAIAATQNFRTSPVKRGAWVLDTILGTPPPQPPPNVPPLEDSNESGKVLTLRQQMESHRKNQPCAGCHRIMDPIGFALENFDADGSWRTRQGGEGGPLIDTAVTLYDGQTVDGPVGLRKALLRYSPQFSRNFVEKLMTYAMGRGVEDVDMPTVRSIVRTAATQNNRFSAIVMGIVTSPQFGMRVKGAENATSTN